MLGGSRILFASLCCLALAGTVAPARAEFELDGGYARRVPFNDDWRFHRGEAPRAEQPDFDDSSWRQLRLPHDWAIEGPFDRQHDARTGGLPIAGIGWYRKAFRLPAEARGNFYAIEFDGAMANSRVWLNGRLLGHRPYGYIGFGFDLTPHLRFDGQPNVLAVQLSPEERSSRWYPGAGIYRNVWLVTTNSVHVARWGTYVTTPEVRPERAIVSIRTELRNRQATAVTVALETSILDETGVTVGAATAIDNIAAETDHALTQRISIARPELWDVDRPYLYTAVSVVKEGDRVLDVYETPFGIRTLAFDPRKGFLLNGRYRKLKGVCLHHDLGPLGAAVNRRATERQLQIMKSMGVNAIRTSHNPPSPEQLEFCDRLGLVVMDEAFDVWRMAKVPNGYNKFFDEWSETDLRDMIRRDRNHPSVIMWSIGNEIREQSQKDGWQVAQRLTDICHDEDPTRPVTAGFNNWDQAIANGLADQVDIPGFNYKPMHYAQILDEHPDWVIVGAESASTVSSRGTYHLPVEKYEKHPSLQLSSYDVIAPPWAYLPDAEFAAQDMLPQVLGEFIWTGFDYLGEPTPFNRTADGAATNNPDWPSRSSYFGAVDLCGFPKDRYYLYQSVWTDEPMVHILPHWNWTGQEGKEIPVFAYTNCDAVELFLNGRSLGRKQRFSEPVELPVGQNVSATGTFRSKYRLAWSVPYEPGLLRAVGFRGNVAVRTMEVRTAGSPARVVLVPDRTQLRADGEDLSFVTVRIEDKDGNLCPEADHLVKFRIEGPGEIAAVGNGNAATVEPFQASERKSFNGLCLAIVRTVAGQPGEIRVTAATDGLESGETVVAAEASGRQLAGHGRD